METPGLNHIILTISNVERSRAFYGGVLGFEVEDFADGLFFFRPTMQFQMIASMNFGSALIT